MKKITRDSIYAFMNDENFRSSNTEVVVLPNETILKLFGNEIAYRKNNIGRTIMITNAGWRTNTTKERLNGIEGVYINQSKGVWYLNGEEWNGRLTEI
tara:strand:- start:500 stop:793 length:294 start_codon:yes stop_codon:yes gene_type:complete